MDLKFNPFNDEGISSFSQYKNYPFLVFKSLDMIDKRIDSSIREMKKGYNFQERLILIGDRGIGKTSTLFFIKEKIEKENFRCEIFSKLPQDENHLMTMVKMNKSLDIIQKGQSPKRMLLKDKETFNDLTKKPIYFLIDFPDSISAKDFKGFLVYVWNLMTHINMNNINLIFTMNKSHYSKSFSYGETLGKFTTLRIERLEFEPTLELIGSRLNLIDLKLEDVFIEDALSVVYSYSKGIPRNIVSACKLLVDCSLNGKISKEFTESILKEKYVDQVINDRVEDLELRRIYRQMVEILKNDYEGVAKSQEDYVKIIIEKCNIGRNSAISRISDLVKFGVFKQYKGGYNRLNKIISFA